MSLDVDTQALEAAQHQLTNVGDVIATLAERRMLHVLDELGQVMGNQDKGVREHVKVVLNEATTQLRVATQNLSEYAMALDRVARTYEECESNNLHEVHVRVGNASVGMTQALEDAKARDMGQAYAVFGGVLVKQRKLRPLKPLWHDDLHKALQGELVRIGRSLVRPLG